EKLSSFHSPEEREAARSRWQRSSGEQGHHHRARAAYAIIARTRSVRSRSRKAATGAGAIARAAEIRLARLSVGLEEFPLPKNPKVLNFIHDARPASG